MRHRSVVPFLLLLAATAGAVHAQKPVPTPAAAEPAAMDFEQARFAAGQDEAKLDGDQLADLSQRQSDFMRPLIARCTRGVRARDLTPVGLVIELDAQGRVVRTWQDVHTPVADCLAAAVAGQVVWVPPKAPFRSMSDLHWQH